MCEEIVDVRPDPVSHSKRLDDVAEPDLRPLCAFALCVFLTKSLSALAAYGFLKECLRKYHWVCCMTFVFETDT
jgi:hypothetical protein